MGIFSSSKTATKPANLPHSFSNIIMDDTISAAGELIRKWEVSDSGVLFAGEDRQAAAEYLLAVARVQRVMGMYVADAAAKHYHLLVQAQSLMQTAMKRLQKEFYRILADNRYKLDLADSVSVSGRGSSTNSTVTSSSFSDDEEYNLGASVAMSDLRSIADCMIGAGYGKECAEVYKVIRKSIVDEALYKMGFVAMSGCQLQRMDWDKLEHKIKLWVGAFREAFHNIFPGERALADNVFFASDVIKESCFSAVACDAALALLAFPELVVVKCKKLPERMFKFLDMYDAVADLWPEIDLAFAATSFTNVREATATGATKLAEAVRVILSEFESAIQKDPAKGAVPGGGIHPAARYVMNYVCFLAEYGNAMAEILADVPMPCPMLPDSLISDCPSSTFNSDNPTSAVAIRLGWIILVLLFKLDAKAELYKDAGLSYLFLCNNLHYIVGKVRSSGGLRVLLGEDWLIKHEEKTRLYASNYERMVWSTVASATAAMPVTEEQAIEVFNKFNVQFDEAIRRQSGWIVVDRRLKEDIKSSAARAVVPQYSELYRRHRGAATAAVVRFSPEDLENRLSDLFERDGGAGEHSSSAAWSAAHSSR